MEEREQPVLPGSVEEYLELGDAPDRSGFRACARGRLARSTGLLAMSSSTMTASPKALRSTACRSLDTDLPRQDLGTYQDDGRGDGSLSQVARFIHLNGPPGIGKSTVASAFADRHPGVLNLDIDQVAALIGGYRDRFSDSFEAGRLLAAAMARVHLANGHDVIMPQMMTNVNAGELADFESAAAVAKAEYCQILLIARVEPSVDRCMERAKGGNPRQDVISKVIEKNGGRDFLRKLHLQVTQFTAGRQPHSVIDCERLTVEQTCQAVEAALRPS